MLLAAVQGGSDAVFSRAAARFSLPAQLRPEFGAALYRTIERAAPAPYVEAMLEREAFDRGDLKQARIHALRLPPSARRDDLLGMLAWARGDDVSAQRYFLQAGDVFAIAAQVDRLAGTNPAAAYDLEMRLNDRLRGSATHPDALAESYWRLGQLATQRGYKDPSARNAWFLRGMRDYRRAVSLAPLTEKYLLAAGSQALNLKQWATARRFYRRAVEIDPAGADAYAGMGIAAYHLGDRAQAVACATRSRSIDPRNRTLRDLETLVR